MKDDKFEQLLQVALIPPVEKKDITLKREMKRTAVVRHSLRTAVAIAACFALLVSLDLSGAFKKNQQSGAVSDHSFSITCYASELEPGTYVPIALNGDENVGCVVGEDDENIVHYNISFGMLCEGENISEITYSINEGAFIIIEKKNESILKNYEEYEGKKRISATMYPSDFVLKEGETESKYDVRFVSEYTVEYDSQDSSNALISVAGVEKNLDNNDRLFSEDNNEKLNAYSDMMENVVITCKVTYDDGTCETKDIHMKGVMASEGFPTFGYGVE